VIMTHSRIAMNKALEDLCYGSNLTVDESIGDSYETCARIKLAVFKDQFCTKPLFVQYFEKEWEPCMGKTFCFMFNITHIVTVFATVVYHGLYNSGIVFDMYLKILICWYAT
jgi:hypothetical protein